MKIGLNYSPSDPQSFGINLPFRDVHLRRHEYLCFRVFCSIYESIEIGGIDADELQNILQKVIGDFKTAYSVFRGKI
jgi:hypothetical protein